MRPIGVPCELPQADRTVIDQQVKRIRATTKRRRARKLATLARVRCPET